MEGRLSYIAVAAVLAAIGCKTDRSGEQEPLPAAEIDPSQPRPIPVEVPTAKERTDAHAYASERWWTAAHPCPEGATLERIASDKGERIECLRPDGSNHGPATQLHPGVGTIRIRTAYSAGERDGLTVSLSRSGAVSRVGRHAGGLRVGRWTAFSRGKLQSQTTWNDDRSVAHVTFWYSGGATRMQYVLLDDRADGTIRTWAPDGRLLDEYMMSAGTGEWRTTYPDGHLASSGQMVRGKREGAWYSYDHSGVIIKTEHYKNDRLVPAP